MSGLVQVHTISFSSLEEYPDKRINDFIKNHRIDVIDIKYYTVEKTGKTLATIMYREH